MGLPGHFGQHGGVNLPIASATYTDLSTVDIGSWFGPEFNGERVPTLSQVLTLCKGQIKVNIELKYYGADLRLAERMVEVVESHGMADDLIVMSLRYDAVLQMKALRPDWSVGLLTAVAVGDLTRVRADVLAVNASLVRLGSLKLKTSSKLGEVLIPLLNTRGDVKLFVSTYFFKLIFYRGKADRTPTMP